MGLLGARFLAIRAMWPAQIKVRLARQCASEKSTISVMPGLNNELILEALGAAVSTDLRRRKFLGNEIISRSCWRRELLGV
mmetsp:Transcript_32038/g.65240  ORF Transcript_32038/g.65240 Transcript_32038/m.65240 type:complete len:81 (+) Transcript_32038:273-515(+)